MKQFEGYKYIEGGVCAAKGFKASGVYCGIKKSEAPDGNESPLNNKNDIALVVSDVMCNATAVYTQNKVKGAPIIITKKNLDYEIGIDEACFTLKRNSPNCKSLFEKSKRFC